MVSLVSQTTAICAAALVALLPGVSQADTASVTAHARPVVPPRAWAMSRSGVGALGAESELPTPLLSLGVDSLALDPVIASWWTPDGRTPLKLELRHPVTLAESPASVDLLAGLNLSNSVPPLIRYTDDETDLTLSISPGSPCTGACLKLAGSF